MKRKITTVLNIWKNSSHRKPLLLQGARQVGKTHSLLDFGHKEFPQVHLFDFMEQPELSNVFEQDLKPERIIRDLSIMTDIDIDLSNDLIIFDEIQQCPKALTSLKYFAQKMNTSYIVASGSLLGTSLSSDSFPVGKIERKYLYPMDFEEFLEAMDELKLLELWKNTSCQNPIIDPLHRKLWEQFKRFMITGGLPEVVRQFREQKETPVEAFSHVRKLQKGLIKDYLDDISKHSGKIKAVKIEAIFKNIPIQLAREQTGIKKFIFKDVLTGTSRYSQLEAPIEWLIKAGLIIKVPVCNTVARPLKAYADEKRFKLYLFDSGILGAMLNLAPSTIFSYDYGSYKGYFAENIVLNEIIKHTETNIYSWHQNSAEIEFLVEKDGDIIPLEVKAGISTKAKSLKVYIDRYAPSFSVLLSGRAVISLKNKHLQLPLYLAQRFFDLK